MRGHGIEDQFLEGPVHAHGRPRAPLAARGFPRGAREITERRDGAGGRVRRDQARFGFIAVRSVVGMTAVFPVGQVLLLYSGVCLRFGSGHVRLCLNHRLEGVLSTAPRLTPTRTTPEAFLDGGPDVFGDPSPSRRRNFLWLLEPGQQGRRLVLGTERWVLGLVFQDLRSLRLSRNRRWKLQPALKMLRMIQTFQIHWTMERQKKMAI